MYRTGDVVRWLADGTIDFIGRLDDLRSRSGDFAWSPARNRGHAGPPSPGRAATVAARRAPSGDARLTGYVVGEDPLDARELREFLRQTLPEYMIPTAFMKLNRLPERERQSGPPVAAEPAETADKRLRSSRATKWSAGSPRSGERFSRSPGWASRQLFRPGRPLLLAVRMFARLEETLRIRLPLATLFRTPTIEGLARDHRPGRDAGAPALAGSDSVGWKSSPSFRRAGRWRQWLCYHDLARLMGPERPFYGLQSRGLDGKDRPLTRIEDIAAAFLEELRQVQPHGPYNLLGVCMGGVVAYEMAQQLRAAGQEVAPLVLIDAWLPGHRQSSG